MRLCILFTILIGVVLVSPCAIGQDSLPATPTQDDRQATVKLPDELDQVLRDYEKAWRAQDAPALAKLFAQDGFVMPNGHTPVRGQEAIARYYQGHGGPLHLRAFAYSQSGEIAFILGGYATEMKGPDVGKFTLTLRKSGDRWLIFSDMDSSNRRIRRGDQ